MNIEAKIWKMVNGELVEIKADNHIFVLKEPTIIKIEPKTELKANTTYMVPTAILPKEIPKRPYEHNVKKTYLEKWIQNGVFEVFTLEMFFKAYPMQKENRNLDRNILKLLKAKKIAQLSKNKYMVVR